MNKHLLTLLNILYWTIAFAFLAFFIAVEIPKKGVNWSDLGLYYAISNNYLFGQFNEYGLAGLLNALLIKIHFGYLNLSRFFYFLQFIAGFLFVFGLRMRATFYWVAPIDRFPLLYYIFNRIGYSPFFYLDSQRDLDKLRKADAGNGYCYFGDFIFEKYAHSTLQNATMTKYRMLYDWLQKYSKKFIYIPVTCIGCVQNGFVKVYVG